MSWSPGDDPLRAIPLDNPDNDDPMVVSVGQYPGKPPHMRLTGLVGVLVGDEGVEAVVEQVAHFDLDRAGVEELRAACEEFLA